jgi:histone deacetylase 1/2
MPVNEYYEYFGPDYTLHVAPSNMENKNTRNQLDDIRSKLLDNLSKLRHAPSVQFQERPPDTELPEPDEDQADPDERHDPDSDMEVDDHKAVEESTRRSSILGIRVKREFGENETKIQDGSRVTSEHRGLEPMVEDIGPSKQAPADANAMAIDEPGNVKNEPESSTKLPDQPAMYHKP